MDIVIRGPGETVICFVDREGRTLMQERLRCSGSATVVARRPVDLTCQTRGGKVSLSPILMSRGETQHVTFDGEDSAAFTRKRCVEIGCTAAVAEEAAQGSAKLLRTALARLRLADDPSPKLP